MPKTLTPLGQRVKAAGMDFPMLAFVTNISFTRLEEGARGRVHLTNEELDKIDRAIRHKPIVMTLWRRAAEDPAAVKITTGLDGVMKVEAGA